MLDQAVSMMGGEYLHHCTTVVVLLRLGAFVMVTYYPLLGNGRRGIQKQKGHAKRNKAARCVLSHQV
jgi:hypothetical protein